MQQECHSSHWILNTLVPDDVHPVRMDGNLQNPYFKVTGEKLDLTPYREQRYFSRRGYVVKPKEDKPGDSKNKPGRP